MECSRDRREDRGSSIPSSGWEVEERAEGVEGAGGHQRWALGPLGALGLWELLWSCSASSTAMSCCNSMNAG